MNLRKLLDYRVNGSTLLEVTVAIIIISIIFGLATVIYINVQRTVLSGAKLSAELLVNDVYSETCRKKDFTNKEITHKNIVIYQTVLKYNAAPDMLVVILEARDGNGKLFSEQKHLVYATE